MSIEGEKYENEKDRRGQNMKEKGRKKKYKGQ
jgi:hypothetical protein